MPSPTILRVRQNLVIRAQTRVVFAKAKMLKCYEANRIAEEYVDFFEDSEEEHAVVREKLLWNRKWNAFRLRNRRKRRAEKDRIAGERADDLIAADEGPLI
jgi:hypothetical protein